MNVKTFCIAAALLFGVVHCWTDGLIQNEIKKIIGGGVNSADNSYAWGMAVDGDTMVIGSNRFHENNTLTGMVIGGAMTAEMAFLVGVKGSQYSIGTPGWGTDNSASIFKCTGLLTVGPTVTCTVVKKAGDSLPSNPYCQRPACTAVYVPGTPCPQMRAVPAMFVPETYGYRNVMRVGGYWVALGLGTVVLGMPVKVWVSATANAGTWIDVTGNMDVFNPVNCATGVYVQPREMAVFNTDLCITVSKMKENATAAGLDYYVPAMMCKPIASLADTNVQWVNRVDGVAMQVEGNTDLFFIQNFPGFMGHTNALFASINNYGYDDDISLGGYQVWYTFGDVDANNNFVWTKLIGGGFGDAAAQMGMTMKYWNNKMYIGSATWMGFILNPDSSLNGVGKGFELVRVDVNGNVQLLVGDAIPRVASTAFPDTRGLAVFQAGFGWPFNAYPWQIQDYKNFLYIGTYDAFSKFYYYGRNAVHAIEEHPEYLVELADGVADIQTLLGYVDAALDIATQVGIPIDAIHAALDDFADDTIFNSFAGYDLWRSGEGSFWVPIITGGLSNGKQVGIRRMSVANNKLYYGTASFYGSDSMINYPEKPTGFEVYQGKDTEYWPY